jgi:hypothetical protein
MEIEALLQERSQRKQPELRRLIEMLQRQRDAEIAARDVIERAKHQSFQVA